MIRRFFAWAALAVFLVAAPGWAAQPTVDQRYAVLQGLDKITARVSEFEVEVGTVAEFGTLSLTLRACRATLPEEAPETAAFLEISDLPPGEDAATLIFSGWMFASSPALSALEHAIYDVWVIGCVDAPRPRLDQEIDPESVPDRVPLPEAGIIPPKLPAARAGR